MRTERVSLIVPMYNEAAHVERLVEEIAAQDFEGEMEIFVADGRSTDGSVAGLERAARAQGLDVTVIDNPSRWVSHGLNACIERCTGDLIVRLDCHTSYPPDFVRRIVQAADETNAWGVGALARPIGTTVFERAAACALDSPFGGVHWTRHASTPHRVEVDNFYLGAYRPEVFRRIGGFDESLVRNQDDEFNLRIRRAGGTIILDPTIQAYLTPRSSLRAVFRQYFEYGLWKVPVMRKHGQVLSARSIAPIAFVGTLTGLGAASLLGDRARRLLALEIGAYLACALAFGATSVIRRGEPVSLLPKVVALFPTIHVAYGVGMAKSFIAPPAPASAAAPESPKPAAPDPGERA